MFAESNLLSSVTVTDDGRVALSSMNMETGETRVLKFTPENARHIGLALCAAASDIKEGST